MNCEKRPASFDNSTARLTEGVNPIQLSEFRIQNWPALLLVLVVMVPACRRRERPFYAVVPKGQANSFWQTVHAGAVAEAREAGVDIDWNGPALESDFTRQVTIVDDFINRHVDGIELAPNDREALVPAIHRAHLAGIPLTVIDSGANTDEYVSFVATDNYGGGVMGARRLGQIIGGHGDVALIANAPGSASTLAREQGFKDTLAKEFPGIKLVAWQYGMAEYARSLAVTEDILTAHSEISGLFASNESSAVGAVQGVKARGLAGKIKIVGFDSSPTLLDALRSGTVDALVVQDPFQMAYVGLKTLIDQRAGRRVKKEIDLPPTLVTHDNLTDPKIEQLLSPDINKYLK